MSAPYIELAAATNFSFLRGASHPGEMVRQAEAIGLAGIGIADRNSFAGVVRAHVEAKKIEAEKVEAEKVEARKACVPAAAETTEAGTQAFRFLVGTRLVTSEGFEAIAYPIDRAAYGRLCRLLTDGNRRARKGECRFAFTELLAASPGVVFIALPPLRAPSPPKSFVQRLESLAEMAPGRTYLAGRHHRRGDEPRRLGLLARLGEGAGAPLVAVQDALYHHPDRRPLQDVIACIREGCTIAEAGFRLEANAERHLRPPKEMAHLFADHPAAVARTIEIAEACTFSLDELKYEYPEEPVPPGKTAQRHLEDLTWQLSSFRFPDGMTPEIEAAVHEELALIAELDHAHYFLTIHDIVQFARNKGILCQGRGSAANSVVCYCLGITAVDPREIKLLFARFISTSRGEPPDIDVDFEHERREEVIQHLYQRYGRARAAICATVIHYRPRMAIREVGKALGLTPDVTAVLADTVWGSWGRSLPDSHVAQTGLDPDNPQLRQALALANELVGVPRHLSQHVGGFVLTRHRLDDTVPVGNAAMPDRTFIEWDKDDIDAVGLLKVDVLGLGMLSCLRRARDLMNDHNLARAHGMEVFETLAQIPGDDRAVYDMLCRADTVGVFQVESRAQMSMLPRLRPRKFYDIVVEVAIVRPGPIQGDMVHPYLRRRESREPVVYPAPDPAHGKANELVEVLEKTYGVPLFQEQAMRIAIVAAGFTPAEADELRRAMATFKHVGTIGTLEEKFVGGMVRRGYPQDFAARCFKQIKGFSTYGFPESHAASFALLVYASAWIKHHHPDVFLAAILNAQPMGFYRPAQLVRDARAHGVEVRGPDVNHSDWDCTLEPAEAGRAVRLGLRLVAGVGEAAMARLVAHRGNGYASVEGLRVSAELTRAAVERLAEADCFRSLGLDRRAALWAVRALDRAMAEAPLLALAANDGLFRAEPAVPLAPMRLPEHVAEDYSATGLSLKGHPCAFFRASLARLGAITAAEHGDPRRAPDSRVTVAGIVLTRQSPGTAKGVVFLTLEDETGIANIIVWRKVFEANRPVAMNARFIAVTGRLQRAGEVVHVLAERFRDLTHHLSRLRGEPFRLPPETDDGGAPDRRAYRSRDFH